MAKNKTKQTQLEEAAKATVTQSASDTATTLPKSTRSKPFALVGFSVLALAGVGFYVFDQQLKHAGDTPSVNAVSVEIPQADEQGELLFPVERENGETYENNNIQISDPVDEDTPTSDTSSIDLMDILKAKGFNVVPLNENEEFSESEESDILGVMQNDANLIPDDSSALEPTEINGMQDLLDEIESLTKPFVETNEQATEMANAQSAKIESLSRDISSLESALENKKTSEEAIHHITPQTIEGGSIQVLGTGHSANSGVKNTDVILTTLILDILEAYPRGSLNIERLTTAEFVAQTMRANPELLTALAHLKTVSEDGVVTAVSLLNTIQKIKNTKRYTSAGLLSADAADSATKAFIKRHMSRWVSIRTVETADVTAALDAELTAISTYLLTGQPKKALAQLDASDDNLKRQLAELKSMLIKHVVQSQALRKLKQAYQRNITGDVL